MSGWDAVVAKQEAARNEHSGGEKPASAQDILVEAQESQRQQRIDAEEKVKKEQERAKRNPARK